MEAVGWLHVPASRSVIPIYVGLVRLISIALLAAGLLSAAGPDAKQLAKDAEKAERAGDAVRAYLLYSQAAVADRSNRIYWARAQALRAKAEVQSKTSLPNPDIEFQGGGPRQRNENVVGSFTTEDLDELARMQSPPRLKPVSGRKSYHHRGDPKALFEKIAAELGYQVIFDKDYNPPTSPIRFNLEDADYREALYALEVATNSFLVPISDTAMLVAQDTVQKRTELENNMAIAVPIPFRTTVQEAQEMAVAVQQTFEIRRVVVDPQRRQIFIRDRVSKVEAARIILNQLSIGKPQVALDIEFLSTGATSSLSFGLDLPTSFPIVHFGKVLNSKPSIPAGFTRFLTFGGGRTFFGIGVTDASMFATASRSSANSLLRSTITASDGQPATLHVGDKYPIVTGGFVPYGGGITPGTPGSPGQRTDAALSISPYADLFTSPVSLNGEMRLIVNGIEYPILLTQATNNLVGLQSFINSFGAGVYASVVQRGTRSRSLTLVVVANALGISEIRLVDDPEGAKVETLMPSDRVSAITSTDYQTRSTVSREGTLALVVGEDSYPIVLTTETNNLAGLRDAINEAKADVVAGIRPGDTGAFFLQVFPTKSGMGTIQVFDDPDGAKLALLTRTNEVDESGSQFGEFIPGQSTNGGGNLGGAFGQNYGIPPAFTFEDLGLILKITPTVHGLEEMTLNVEAEFKVLGAGAFNGIPVISTRKYQGQVRLRSNEWAVVAGMLSETESKAITGLAGLSTLPVIGPAFRRNTTAKEETNILLVLKPRVTSLPPSETAPAPLWIGSETRPPSVL